MSIRGSYGTPFAMPFAMLLTLPYRATPCYAMLCCPILYFAVLCRVALCLRLRCLCFPRIIHLPIYRR